MEFVNGLLVYAHLGAGVATVWISRLAHAQWTHLWHGK